MKIILVKGIDKKDNKEAKKILMSLGVSFEEEVNGKKILSGKDLPQIIINEIVHSGVKGMKEFIAYHIVINN